MNDEEIRKRRMRAEFKRKIIDEKKQEYIPPGERKFVGKGKTPVDVHPTLKSSAEQYGEKDKQKTTATESRCDPIADGARAMVRSTAKKIKMKKPVNETNQIDELSGASLRRYKAAATDDLRGMSSLKKETDYPDRPKDSLDKKIKSRASFVKLAKKKMQEQAGDEMASRRPGALEKPMKMKYIGPSFKGLNSGDHVHVHAVGHGGGVRVVTSQGMRVAVHRKELQHVDEQVIDELSRKSLVNYTLKAEKAKSFAKDQRTIDKRANGQKQALEKIGNKVFKEEHSFITDLRLAIESNGVHPVTFADGARAAISPGYADRILAKYEAISEESKKNEFVSTVSSSLKTLRESVKR